MRGSTSIAVGNGVEEGKRMDYTLQTYIQNPETFHTLVKAAVSGDRTVLPEVRALLDTVPEWGDELGNLLQQTENTLLDMSIGKNLLRREAITRDLDEHARRLTEEPSYVEALLIRQIRLDLLMLHTAQQRAQERRDIHSDKLLNSAHRRFLASLKSLEQMRKLAPAIRIQIAENQINMS